VHGYQYADEEKRYWPTSYFGPTSGVGMAIRFHPRRLNPVPGALRIGVVGLGTGTLSAYGNPGDYFRFYEINPDVVQFSEKYFTYRKDSAARIDIALGDARILMEREKSKGESGRFDVLALDAFSGDAIPVHLLTRECYAIYQYHLKPDGILALHVSNRYFNLNPVVRSLARSDVRNEVQVLRMEDEGSHLQGTDATSWILITANGDFLANQRVRSAVAPWDAEDEGSLLFTDDYSNLFRLLRK
jgi:SAM-dependent methyltransferase